MKSLLTLGALTLGVSTMLLSAPDANALGHVQKVVTGCPKNGVVLVPVGGRFNIDDVIISANKNQKVTLKFTPGPINLMQVFVKGYDTVVTNFQGQVESEKEQALKMDCAGTAGTTVTVTLVGDGEI